MAESFDLYLASKSPRRRELLTQAGMRFACCEPGEEYEAGGSELDCEGGDPMALAQLRARRKALHAQVVAADVPVLAVDTVVDLAGNELGKAADRDAAAALLARLAGHEHRVHTAHCLFIPTDPEHVFEETATSIVLCESPNAARVTRYLDSDQWRGKAGGYGIQDSQQDFLRLVSGSFDTVVGLHVAAVLRLLQAARART